MPITINGTGSISGLSATGISAQPVFAGNVIQVVSNSSSTTLSNSTTTYSDLITASITPASASNKVIILASCSLSITANTNSYAGTAIYRGTTAGTEIANRNYGINTSVGGAQHFTINHIDSPSTTSAQTYTFAFRKGSVNTTSVTTDGVLYSIILMEVAA